MPEKDEIFESLAELGITEDNYRVLSLLPLVLVAWSDGRVEQAEREKIFRVAGERGLLEGTGGEVLTGWLDHAPAPSYYDLGFRTLVELARRKRGAGADINVRSLGELLDLCFDVAGAAGGLFDQLWTVSAAEREALDTLAGILAVDSGQSWKELIEDLDG